MAKLDFSALGAPKQLKPSDQHTEPRQLFRAFVDRPDWMPYLRGPQDQVLDKWHARREEPDLAVKMNTGGGKTVVGLTIGKSWLNEGVAPVAYLVPDEMLVGQVVEQAHLLGVPVTTDTDSQFKRGEAILVDSFAKLFNSKSVFGISGSYPKSPRFSLAGVIVDDAHACLIKAQQLFRMTVPRTVDGEDNEAYFQLLKLFMSDLKAQSRPVAMELEEGLSQAILEVPFWAWQNQQEAVTRILGEAARSDTWSAWPLLADSLDASTAVVTTDAFQIQPFCSPTHLLTGFANTKRRVYLTATLADDSVLVRDLGAGAAAVAAPIVPEGAGDIGDRMILMPQELIPGASDDEVRAWAAKWAEDRNVVVIVPSRPKAKAWEDYAQLVLDRDSIEDGVAQLKANPRLGLVVMINRYDGIDLPDAACNFLVLDGLPEAREGLERLAEARDTETNSLAVQQVHRIEQGMGRATRSTTDHAVVVLIGTSLTDRVDAAMGRFSPATQLQFERAATMAQALDVSGLEDLDGVVQQCLERDSGWINFAMGPLATLDYETPPVNAAAQLEREAFLSATRSGDYAGATEKQQAAIRQADPAPGATAELRQRLASYVNHFDVTRAQEIQKAAQRDNPQLVRPLDGVKFEALSHAARTQAEAASQYLRDQYASGNSLRVHSEALLSSLTWGPRWREFEKALADVGLHLGYRTQRPDLELGEGPDGLWAATDATFVIWEAKSRSLNNHPVYKGDAEQISMAADWFRLKYPNSPGIPVIIHPRSDFEHDASWPEGCRVLDEKRLGKYQASLRKFFTQVSADDSYRDVAKVAAALAMNGLTEQTWIDRFTTTPARKPAKRPASQDELPIAQRLEFPAKK
ncbi:helicase C-terminal domain-containing protein [Luteococcus japonicus]|uniref:ATP-dependent helicase C-terminal domain-containing protein n=1 Tax=Luteococcus japonicus LSP_Lj1 TaxID=1255658 RepID=A0A1R4J9K1_9ACTN|nr:helicase C-terminal domain-containing protein [Luteococcus japonicus]SJN28800.1 L. lactis predicted coding region ORF00041 [Luteococcus japonicus LSP_Lj1]